MVSGVLVMTASEVQWSVRASHYHVRDIIVCGVLVITALDVQ
jgi:hypothetical protein